MTQILCRCPGCGGEGNVLHEKRTLIEGEAPNPNDLDRYKLVDICRACGGKGKRLIDINVTENPKGEPYYGC